MPVNRRKVLGGAGLAGAAAATGVGVDHLIFGGTSGYRTDSDQLGAATNRAGDAATKTYVDAAIAGVTGTGTGIIVIPEDFGAVGDGVTDDSAAIDTMFNSYTVNNGGSCILLPYGKVYLTDSIDVKDNTFVFGAGTLKCKSNNGGMTGPGGFLLFKNGVQNVTWIGPTLDINECVNVNGFDIGNIDSDGESPLVSDIYIRARVTKTRISAALENSNNKLFSGGGKGIMVGFRARNVTAHVLAEDCDIACSVEATEDLGRHVDNVVLDIQAKDAHRTALFIAGDRDDSASSLDSGSYLDSIYPGVKIRLRAHGGQDASVTHPVSEAVGNNWDHAGVVTLNDAVGVDLQIDAAVEERCTLIRGKAWASTIRVSNALLDELQDGWDTRPIDTLTSLGTFMTDNVFEANIRTATHHGVLVRPHRVSTNRAVVKTRLDVNAWCQNGVGAITQSDGTTDEFGSSVAYRFCDMKSSPIREVVGISSDNALPTWALAASGGVLNNGNIARQSQVVVSGTAYYITNSTITLPNPLKAPMAVGTKFVWTIALDKTAAGTGSFEILIYRGINGTTADTLDVAQSIATNQTAAVDNMLVDVELVVTSTGATGAYYWTIIPDNKAITATGFGVVTGSAYKSGTVSSVALDTAALKFGLGFRSTTGTPTITVPMVKAQAFNIS